jgi:hypothetical protein
LKAVQSKRQPSALSGPLCKVVYIFEREGDRDGGYWLLVLDCGHFVARKRYMANSLAAVAQLMFKPLAQKLAPKRVQCHSCGAGNAKADPWIMIKALGGPTA